MRRMALSRNTVGREACGPRCWVDPGGPWTAVRRFTGKIQLALSSLLVLFVSDQPQDSPYNVTHSQFSGLGRDQALSDLLDALYELLRLWTPDRGNNSAKKAGGSDCTWSGVPNLSPLEQSGYCQLPGRKLPRKVSDLTHAMRVSTDCSTGSVERDFRKEARPGVNDAVAGAIPASKLRLFSIGSLLPNSFGNLEIGSR
jgi:hypothetical protein